MALLSINRELLASAAAREADRQLVRYIRETLAPILPRLPTRPDLVAPFVHEAGQAAVLAGYGAGRSYSFHVMADLLLGPRWQAEPQYSRIARILDDPGMAQDTRLTLAMNAVIEARQELEAALPAMLDAALATLAIHWEALSPRDTWNALFQMARARGVRHHDIRALFDVYEAGFRAGNGLRPSRSHPVSGYAILGYEALGRPIPPPDDDFRDYTPRLAVAFNAQVLLAQLYGLFHRDNALLSDLRRIAADTSNLGEHQAELTHFLRSHRRALTELPDGR
ncbi:hypothetical protein ACFWP0_05335 [Achromobacter sp. NPDC058515]|uniref:hypothetical protein n=1 Tax=Achromobacter sp. NPDC058515 TaxID=3346533 RepID=UPI003656A55A